MLIEYIKKSEIHNAVNGLTFFEYHNIEEKMISKTFAKVLLNFNLYIRRIELMKHKYPDIKFYY